MFRALAVLSALCAMLAAGSVPASADAASLDVASTHAYLTASYRALHGVVGTWPAVEASIHRLDVRLHGECADAGAGSPENETGRQDQLRGRRRAVGHRLPHRRRDHPRLRRGPRPAALEQPGDHPRRPQPRAQPPGNGRPAGARHLRRHPRLARQRLRADPSRRRTLRPARRSAPDRRNPPPADRPLRPTSRQSPPRPRRTPRHPLRRTRIHARPKRLDQRYSKHSDSTSRHPSGVRTRADHERRGPPPGRTLWVAWMRPSHTALAPRSPVLKHM